MNRAATAASGPLMWTRSVSTVPLSATAITCSEVNFSPGNLETPTHIRGGSIDVTVAVVFGPPFAFTVSFAPSVKSPSTDALSMMPPGHCAGSVHTAQTFDAGAEHTDDPSNDRRCFVMAR